MRLLLLTPTLAGNSLGRTFCLHLLAESLGWQAETWSTEGDAVWGPLAAEPFAATCSRTALRGPAGLDELIGRAAGVDLIVAVKPLPASLGLARAVGAVTGIPVISDIDDPDLEVLLAEGRPLRALGKRLLRPGVVRSARTMREAAHALPRLVSNPELQRRHGGTVLPHVRTAPVVTPRTGIGAIDVAFVGSVQPHKGLGVLRSAIDEVADLGYRLTVTADEPDDARPHERWVGRTSLTGGLDLVAAADVVVIPSLSTPWATGQLPVKLVDAMLLGACVVVSDIAPLPWAVGAGGTVVPPGSVSALVAALRGLQHAEERAVRSEQTLALARGRYTVDANRGVFEAACMAAAQR